MAYRAALLNFTKGCISPEAQARFDISIYNAALKQATNVTILKTGGVAKRMGTRFVAECLGSTARLIPFQFSDEQAYALEHGQAYMRPLALGGVILETALTVTAITNAANAQVTVPFHGYAVDDRVWFEDITGMTEINGRFLTVVSVLDANNFTVDFNSTNAGVFTGSGGGQTNSSPPAPPPTPPTVPPVLTPPAIPDFTRGGGRGGAFSGEEMAEF
jgi:hypothetical protein